MPDLSFTAESVAPALYAATPQLTIRVRIASDAPVHSILLRCQVRIEPQRRRYAPEEMTALRELFGEPSRWADTLRSMLWTNASAVVPAFERQIVTEIAIPCTLELGDAAAKYVHAIGAGDVPLLLLFSGTVFHGEPLSASPIPWSTEATLALPQATWRAAIDHFFPGVAQVALSRDVFERLVSYKAASGLHTLDQAIERLLPPKDCLP